MTQAAEIALPLELPSHIESSAVFDDEGTYRYRLVRTWDNHQPVLCLITLHPSKAGVWRNDRTIRACKRLAVSLGYGGIIVRNLYALVCCDPNTLTGHPDPVGPRNDAELLACCEHDLTVLAWGDDADSSRAHQVTAALWRRAQQHGTSLAVLGWTVHGQPCHPLDLDTPAALECITPSDFTGAHDSEDHRWRYLLFGGIAA